MDDLVAEANARTPPAGAFTISEFLALPGVNMKRDAAITFLEEKVADGRLKRAKFACKMGYAWYYWPVNPKAQKARGAP